MKIPPEQGATEYISLRALYQSLPEASKADIANLWGFTIIQIHVPKLIRTW